MTRYIPAKQWKSGPKRKSVSQRIAERRKPKQKFVKRVRAPSAKSGEGEENGR